MTLMQLDFMYSNRNLFDNKVKDHIKLCFSTFGSIGSYIYIYI